MKYEEEMGMIPALTLVLWIGCLVVGEIRWRSPPPQGSPKVQTVDVQITSDAPPMAPMADAAPPTALTEMVVTPPMPDIPAPAPAVEFAEPMPMPDLSAPGVVQAATIPAKVTANVQPGPAIRQITFGEGEGDQPAPTYPHDAVTGHQQGVVVVRFTVGANGRVEHAIAQTPCPWPLLNQEAVRAVRETWKFPAGDARIYEVSITFELNQN